MSDAVIIALIVGAGPVLLGIVNLFQARKRDRTVADIHTLVNSQMGEQLLIGMVSARTLAEARPNEENKRLAEVAEQKYRQHQAKQAIVDNRGSDSP